MAEFYSQHKEDRWITDHLRIPKTGVFVDVGASDGVSCSNTLHFEQLGWTGLAIEGNPNQWAALSRNRKCQIGKYAVGADPNRLFDIHENAGWSGFGRGGTSVKVPVKRLDDALDEANIVSIDLLSIDVEGAELEVWGTFNHLLHTPRIVILEYDTQPLPSNEYAIMDAFYRLPYCMVHRSPGNLIFEWL